MSILSSENLFMSDAGAMLQHVVHVVSIGFINIFLIIKKLKKFRSIIWDLYGNFLVN